MLNEEQSELEFPSHYEYATIGTIIGCFAVLFLVILGFFVDPSVMMMDHPQEIRSYKLVIEAHKSQALLLLVLDSIFIVGYLSLFVGLWLLIRDFTEIIGSVALWTGLFVAFGDIIENAIQFTLIHGISAGWDPDPAVFAWLWILNTTIDLLSYISAIIFAIIYLRVWSLFSPKHMLGILLLLYATIGLLSLIEPGLLIARSIFFVLGLAMGAYVLHIEEDLQLEEIEELLFGKQKKERSDFIR